VKRSEINAWVREARAAFARHGIALPPRPRWEASDYGVGAGIAAVALADEPEYAERLIHLRPNARTPMLAHARRKKDVAVRVGAVGLRLERGPGPAPIILVEEKLPFRRNGRPDAVRPGTVVRLEAGERLTLLPGVYHETTAEGGEAVVAEIVAGSDPEDVYFMDLRATRAPEIDEDEPAEEPLAGEPFR
jgi:D-lyxose ketol-isomerase